MKIHQAIAIIIMTITDTITEFTTDHVIMLKEIIITIIDHQVQIL